MRDIYNHAVLHTTATYDFEPQSLEARLQWWEEHERDGWPVWVAEGSEGVVGWSSLSRYHVRCGFRFTGETSVYVAPEAQGRGLGGRLMEPLIEGGRERGLHTLLAAVDATNQVSLKLHERFGFVRVGHFREVGHKFGRWLDVVYLQRLL